MQLYLLKKVPLAVSKKDYKSFSSGLDDYEVRGIQIKVSQMAKPNKDKKVKGKADPHTAQHIITLMDYNDEGKLVNKPNKTCKWRNNKSFLIDEITQIILTRSF